MSSEPPVASVRSWHFHWKFWQFKQCIDGPVLFGWWARVEVNTGVLCFKTFDLSAQQVRVKQSMGLIE